MNSIDILKQHNLKVTKPREAILDLLHNSKRGIDAETIKNELQKTDLFVNLSTIYRALETFEGLKIVEKFDLGDKRYNYILKKHDHLHRFKCEACKKDFELECPMSKIEELIAKETGFVVTNHHIELSGICKDCQKKLQEENE